jgi:hypothetical protein
LEHPIEDLEDDNEKTPLSQRLGKLANYIEQWAILAAFLIFATMVIFVFIKIIFSG